MIASSDGFAAVLERRGRFIVARELFPRARGTGGPLRSRGQLTVDPTRARAREGDLVFVRIGGSKRGGRAQIERRIGRPDVARDVIEALMLERGLRRRFDPAVEREAREASGAAAERADLRHLPTFTIDPTGARDYDDAISAQALPDGGTRVWVHIADVAAFVRQGSLVDREARRRATSVYVPGGVEPMLPPALSNEKCSLVPGQERLAVTAEMDLDGARVDARGVHALADSLGRATGLRPRRPDLRRQRDAAGPVGRAAGAGARTSRAHSPANARGAAGSRSRAPSPTSSSTARAMSDACGWGSRPSRTA